MMRLPTEQVSMLDHQAVDRTDCQCLGSFMASISVEGAGI